MKSGVIILWEIIILQIVVIQNFDSDPSSILFKKEKNTNNGLVFLTFLGDIYSEMCEREL